MQQEMDKMFSTPPKKQFEFDHQVAAVFDNMIARSIPFYEESLRLGVRFLISHLDSLEGKKTSRRVLDLGSASGNFLIKLAEEIKKIHTRCKLIGVDNSAAMCKYAKNKARAYGYAIQFICQDILDFDFKSCEIIIANYTLQFIRPIKRDFLVQKIYDALKKEGLFLLSEKTSSLDKFLDKSMIDLHEEFKQNQGYGSDEISIKRQALENVLIPYNLEENLFLLKNAGFKHVEVIFRWGNFATLLARK